jgi:hypothetical protein
VWRRQKFLTRAGNRPACNNIAIIFFLVPKYSAGIVLPIPTTNLLYISNQLGDVVTKNNAFKIG